MHVACCNVSMMMMGWLGLCPLPPEPADWRARSTSWRRKAFAFASGIYSTHFTTLHGIPLCLYSHTRTRIHGYTRPLPSPSSLNWLLHLRIYIRTRNPQCTAPRTTSSGLRAPSPATHCTARRVPSAAPRPRAYQRTNRSASSSCSASRRVRFRSRSRQPRQARRRGRRSTSRPTAPHPHLLAAPEAVGEKVHKPNQSQRATSSTRICDGVRRRSSRAMLIPRRARWAGRRMSR
jgi:hypothetical protein